MQQTLLNHCKREVDHKAVSMEATGSAKELQSVGIQVGSTGGACFLHPDLIDGCTKTYIEGKLVSHQLQMTN